MNGQDELRELWKNPASCDNTKGEDMLAVVQKKIRRFDRMIAMRNLLECTAALLVAGFFAWSAVRMPTPIMKAGCLVVAAGAAWIIFYVFRYGKSPVSVDPSQNVTVYTQALIKSYDHQIRLLKSVKYWYLLPMYIGLLIISAGLFLQRVKAGSFTWHDLGGPAIYTVVFAAVWWLNEVPTVAPLRKERAKLVSILS